MVCGIGQNCGIGFCHAGQGKPIQDGLPGLKAHAMAGIWIMRQLDDGLGEFPRTADRCHEAGLALFDNPVQRAAQTGDNRDAARGHGFEQGMRTTLEA